MIVGGYVKLVVFKFRVVFVKELIILRLEFFVVLILVRFIIYVKEVLEFDVIIINMICWIDLRVILFWIKGEEREWK